MNTKIFDGTPFFISTNTNNNNGYLPEAKHLIKFYLVKGKPSEYVLLDSLLSSYLFDQTNDTND